MNPSIVLLIAAVFGAEPPANWYEQSFFLLHEDHHTSGTREVGRDADLAETRKLVGLCRPDVIQIHAKGNPGWTTYPSRIGYTPPKLAKDVLGIWRDTARLDGYHFSVYYNLGRDGEIMKRHPEWNRSRADGKEWDRALCYHSGVAEHYLWPMIREIMTGYHPDGFWFDGSCFTIRVCYCDACRSRFRREQHSEAPTSPDQPGWRQYQEMQRQIYREFVHKTAAMIHENDPKCLVAVNWAYSLRMPEKPDPEIDYLTGDIGNGVEGLSAAAHWYDGQCKPFDLMTQLNTMQPANQADSNAGSAPSDSLPATAITSDNSQRPGNSTARHADENAGEAGARLRMAPKPRVQIEQEMAVIIANGGRYFVWDNPTPESGLTPERFVYMRQVVAPFLRARQAWCLGYQRVPDVSLLNAASAHYAVTEQKTTSFTRPDNRIDGACRTLAQLHLNYEMLGQWRLLDQDVRSPVLVVEHPKRLSSETRAALIDFVRAGGHLLMTGMGLVANERFADLFGLRLQQNPTHDEPLRGHLPNQEVAFRHWLYRVAPTGAETLISVADQAGRRYPFLTGHQYGQGKAFYVSVPLLSLHGPDVVPEPLIRAVFEHAVPAESRWLTSDAPDTVEVVLRKKGNRYAIHLVNMAPGDRQSFKVGTRGYTTITGLPPVPRSHVSARLPARPKAVWLEPQHQELPDWKYDCGRLTVELPEFAVHQVVAIQLAP